jgi:hypothetical protein
MLPFRSHPDTADLLTTSSPCTDLRSSLVGIVLLRVASVAGNISISAALFGALAIDPGTLGVKAAGTGSLGETNFALSSSAALKAIAYFTVA